MPATSSTRSRRPGQPLKSPLAVVSARSRSGPPRADAPERPGPAARATLSEREATMAEYEDHLRTTELPRVFRTGDPG
jgi:hypothetical protein